MRRAAGPTVSIIIPCYNQGRFLAEAVESALGQTYRHVQVTVIDDGSTDETPAVASRYIGRIRYIRQENAGVSVARNVGILEARGEFILFLDADDYLRPDALEKHLEAARATPTGSVFHGGSEEIDLCGRFLEKKPAQPLPRDAFHALLLTNPFPLHSLLIRRSAFAKAGLFDASLPPSEDWEMCIRLAAAGCEFVAVPDAVAVYRRYFGSMSTDSARIWRTGVAVLAKSGAHHTNCALCRKQIARARRRKRSYCFSILKRELTAYRAREGRLATLLEAARAARRTPGLAPLFLSDPLRRTLKSMVLAARSLLRGSTRGSSHG